MTRKQVIAVLVEIEAARHRRYGREIAKADYENYTNTELRRLLRVRQPPAANDAITPRKPQLHRTAGVETTVTPAR